MELDTTMADETLRRMARLLSPRQLAKIGARVTNRAGRAAGVALSKEIRRDLAVKSSVVKDALKTERATPANLTFTFRVSNKPVPMKEFRARQTRRGVGVTIKKSAGRQTLVEAFIIDLYGGEVFRRRGKERAPLRMLYGPSIGSQSDDAWAAAQIRADEIMRRRYEHEITREFEKANR